MVNWSPVVVPLEKRSPWVQVVGHAGLICLVFFPFLFYFLVLSLPLNFPLIPVQLVCLHRLS